jgi:hypothetical protein
MNIECDSFKIIPKLMLQSLIEILFFTLIVAIPEKNLLKGNQPEPATALFLIWNEENAEYATDAYLFIFTPAFNFRLTGVLRLFVLRACVGINSAKEQRWGRAPGVQGVKGLGKISSKKPSYLYYVYAPRHSLRSHQSGGQNRAGCWYVRPGRKIQIRAARWSTTIHRTLCVATAPPLQPPPSHPRGI